MGKYLITFEYDKKNRTILANSKGNVMSFKTKSQARKEIDRRLQKSSYIEGKIRNPRVVLARKRGG